MLKKILASVLAAAMALSVPVMSMGAETIDIDCELSQNSVQVGDIFYADFKITDNPKGYNSMQCYVNFDSTKIQALDCDVEDIPSDLIIYTDEKGVNYSIFSYTNVNGRVNFVPKSGDSDYLGMADGRKKAGELGRIKLANLLNDSIDGQRVNYTGTGTVLRMKFKAIAAGSSEISMTDVIGQYSDENGINNLSFNVNNGEVSISGGGSIDDETTTEATTTTTETTTSASNGGGNGGGSSSGSSNSNKTTTTEASTESTTKEIVIGGDDNETDIKVVSFTDVEDDFWGRDYIVELASKGVVNGYPDGSFKPNDNVKRADFLIMLLRGLGIDISAEKAAENNFSDVDPASYYAKACGIAKEMGIASGNGNGTFLPESYITRQDMMILAKKALEIKLGSEITGEITVLDKFNDKGDISAYAVNSLAAMVDAGIVNGMGEGIAPKANTTRAQATVIISKIIAYIG